MLVQNICRMSNAAYSGYKSSQQLLLYTFAATACMCPSSIHNSMPDTHVACRCNGRRSLHVAAVAPVTKLAAAAAGVL